MSAISKGYILPAGQSLQLGECLTSHNGRYRLELQASDGNLVLYHQHRNGGQRPLWSSETQKTAGDTNFAHELVMQANDGNLVLYRAGHQQNQEHARWASHTNSDHHRGAYLELRNTGSLIVYSAADDILWHSNTRAYAHWMAELDGDLTLQSICVPGSHDAGMYTTKMTVRDGLALTQNLSLYEQLRQGSRYFDLRPRHIGGKGFYLYHGMADGPKLEVVLKDIKQFFDEGTEETVILQFSHWGDFAGQDAAFVKELLAGLPAGALLTSKELMAIVNAQVAALPVSSQKLTTITASTLDLATLPLDQLRGKLIVLIDNEAMYRDVVQKNQHDGIYLRQHSLPLYDSYSNKQDYDQMLHDQTDKFEKFKDTTGLFMLNWTLTPLGTDAYDLGDDAWAGGLIGWAANKAASNLTPLLTSAAVETYAKEINPKLEDAVHSHPTLFGRNAAGRMVNIINLDYVQTAEAVRVCQQLIKNNNKKQP